jgi:uncharacterized membrane protein
MGEPQPACLAFGDPVCDSLARRALHCVSAVALYGFTLFMSAVAYHLPAHLFVRLEGPQSPLRSALGSDQKGATSLALYMVGIGAAFVAPIISLAIYGAVAALWFVPDPRIRGIIPPDHSPLKP